MLREDGKKGGCLYEIASFMHIPFQVVLPALFYYCILNEKKEFYG
jgi:hypothetical protein